LWIRNCYITHAGAFPKWGKPSVIWYGIRDCPELVDLAGDLDDSLNQELNIDKETRPFRSHLTIARLKKGRKIKTANIRKMLDTAVDILKLKNYTVPVSEFHLCASTLTPEGPIYDRLDEYRLGEG
jgi:2'-5' RNA ligase